MSNKYDALKLKNQLCFPLYACSKEVVRMYRPFLREIDLTYTQYIVMMVMWEKGKLNVKELGERLYLDSGTLTPVLKKLEAKGYINRKRSDQDERNLLVTITGDGKNLQKKAVEVPERMAGCMALSPEEAGTLYQLLYKMLGNIDEEKTT